MALLLPSSSVALANFLEAVGFHGPWWYGLNILPSDPNFLSQLLGLTQDRTMCLVHDAGWVWKRGTQWLMSTNGVNNFIKQSLLSYLMECTRVCYSKKPGCLFIRIGSFGEDKSPFGPLEIGAEEKPTILPIILDQLGSTFHALIQLHSVASTAALSSLSSNGDFVVSLQRTGEHQLPINLNTADEKQQKHNATASNSTTLQSSNTKEEETPMQTSNRPIYDTPAENDGSVEEYKYEDNLFGNHDKENKIIHKHLLTDLFPLIFLEAHQGLIKQHMQKLCSGKVASSLLCLSCNILQTRNKWMSERIGAASMTPNPSIKVPTLEKYGIDPTNKAVLGKIMGDIHKISKTTGAKHEVLTMRTGNNKELCGICIPKSSSLDCIRMNNYRHKWIESILLAIGPQNTWEEIKANRPPPQPPAVICQYNEENSETEDSEQCNKQSEESNDEEPWSKVEVTARNFINVIAAKYPKSFRWAAKDHSIGVMKEPLDAIATLTMLSEANMSSKQARIVSCHLRVWFDHHVLCGEVRMKQTIIRQKFVPAHCDTYMNDHEKVEWSVCSPVLVVLYFLDGLFNNPSTRKRWNSLDLVVSCDHGKGFSQAHLVIICRDKDKRTNEWTEYQESFGLADAKCRKDTYRILQNTFMPTINSGLQQLVDSGGIDVWQRAINPDNVIDQENNSEDDNCNPYYMKLAGSDPINRKDVLLFSKIPIECFSAGDLSQLFVNHGRDGYSGSWCCFCDLSKSEWQDDASWASGGCGGDGNGDNNPKLRDWNNDDDDDDDSGGCGDYDKDDDGGGGGCYYDVDDDSGGCYYDNDNDSGGGGDYNDDTTGYACGTTAGITTKNNSNGWGNWDSHQSTQLGCINNDNNSGKDQGL